MTFYYVDIDPGWDSLEIIRYLKTRLELVRDLHESTSPIERLRGDAILREVRPFVHALKTLAEVDAVMERWTPVVEAARLQFKD